MIAKIIEITCNILEIKSHEELLTKTCYLYLHNIVNLTISGRFLRSVLMTLLFNINLNDNRIILIIIINSELIKRIFIYISMR